MNKLVHHTDRFFRDKQGRLVLFQKPNAPILVWGVSTVTNWLVLNASASRLLSLIGTTALTTWAVLEIGWGVNYFRRVLGVVILAWIVFSLLW